MQGNVSFVQAVADFYGVENEDEEEGEEAATAPAPRPPAEWATWSKAKLQQECDRRGIAYRKSWTKPQLLEALTVSLATAVARSGPDSKRPARHPSPLKLSRAAREIVDALEHR
jgi:hypothetical protein